VSCRQVQQQARGQLLVPNAMFDTLSASLSNAFKSLNADAKLTAENMKVRQRDAFDNITAITLQACMCCLLILQHALV
jgi:hypothetical protein